MAAKASTTSVLARRILWLRSWKVDIDSKKTLEGLPFKGDILFGEDLNKIVTDLAFLPSTNPSTPKVSSAAQNLRAGNTESQKTEGRNIESFLSQALCPDETLLNRYAAMIYTSADNGSIFQELDGASVCDSCGEKTVLCPHKVGGTRVICLPKNCSHIKLCRPRAHQCTVKAKIAASMARPGKGGTEITQSSPGNQSATAESQGRQAKRLELLKLEKDFELQLQLKRDLPRAISLDLCVSLTHHLMVTLIRQLEGTSQSLTIQETVWEVLRKRYVNDDISCRGLQDYLSAVVRYSSDSQVVSLLGLVLQCDMDPTVLSYVLLMAEMVSMCPLSNLDQVQLFLHTQYPFLEDTEWDRLLLEFTSYSRRCVSPPTVMGFILHMILQNQEPLITECEDVLSTHTKTHADCLTAEELSGALEEMCPLRSKMQIQSLIQHCGTLSGSSLTPLHKAAQITACQLQRDKQRLSIHHETEENVPCHMPTGGKDTEHCKGIRDLHILQHILTVLRSSGQRSGPSATQTAPIPTSTRHH
ncbi:uncharacterized protein LOC134984583 [Pseudophryne corroboree]|uniref:uncharacterized protein LOC134984583 n=1 Tax=Pseudophryne corroboree TaxID=495146 RepID=UPI003081C2EF